MNSTKLKFYISFNEKNACQLSTCDKLQQENIERVRQSPIKIDTRNAIPERTSAILEWSSGYFENPEKVMLVNTGENFQLKVKQNKPLHVTSKLLYTDYEFNHINFHWGYRNNKGAEHQIDEHIYPLEMQALHSQTVKNYIHKFLIVSHLFKIDNKYNWGFKNFFDAIVDVSKVKNRPIEIKPFPLKQLIYTAPVSYYTYEGSLTNPPYEESAIWIIPKLILPISKNQFEMFTNIAKRNKQLRNNFRKLQDSNNRKVRYVCNTYD